MTTAAMTISPFTHASPIANAAKTDAGTGTAAAISANDFLALLVTEMKNQDPTAQTDPNEYVNQLVQVNSLEQLIEINENLSSASGSPTATASPMKITPERVPGTMSSLKDNGGSRLTNAVAGPVSNSANPISEFAGNLGVSRPIPAAQRIAQALNGRP
jgi:flagellar basal-body rod modification protein FlgD